MRRLQLLTFVLPLLSALGCGDATAPNPVRAQLKAPQRTLAISAATAQVSAGFYHTCAVKGDGAVVCWGDDQYGESTAGNGLSSIAEVSDGVDYLCGRRIDRTVTCWGRNDFGQARPPSDLMPVAHVSAGGYHTCALKTDGTVVCWGSNTEGEATVPIGLASVVQVSAGTYHTCGLKTDGTVVCWGSNAEGEATVPTGVVSIAQVSAGGAHTCALKTDGTVVCWGYNYEGETNVPSGLMSVAQISAGAAHTCALKLDRTVLCWGDNSEGQSTVPSGLAGVTQVSAGGYHTCALKTDGTVVCWGLDYYGESTVPVGLNLNPVQNVAPVVGAITAPTTPIQVNTSMTANAGFTDNSTLDTHTAVFNWGDGSSSTATVSEASGSGTANGTHIYTAAGVYIITLTVTDNSGASGQSLFEFLVVYDPAAGFVTGGGWINSPDGAYAADPTLTGRANFGFVSRYQKGATVPSGNTQFQFQAGRLNFNSTSFDWLVIAGPQAKYKGSGTINGAGDFGFLVSAVDGAVTGGGTDKFRIKIWDKSNGNVVYDNQVGAADDAQATTVIAGGDIVIHS
jgi:alpha-tubulin suppressor-like RCC1 family protein